MRKTILILTILTSFLFTACSGDAEANSFIAESDKFAGDLVQQVQDNPTAAGVDEAQKILDGKKADIKAKYTALRNAGFFQLSHEMKQKLNDSTSNNTVAVGNLKIALAEKIKNDKAFGEKLDKLINDYNAIFYN